MILSVDCGINYCGCALFKDGILHRAWLARSRAESTLPTIVRCAAMSLAVTRNLSMEEVIALTHYVCEWQQAYSRRKSKGDPNKSVLPLVGVAAAIGARLPITCGLAQYLPHEWKGSLDGDKFISRTIVPRLSDQELGRIEDCPPSLINNVYDGIGVGLKWLGRLERKRYISRGTPANGAP